MGWTLGRVGVGVEVGVMVASWMGLMFCCRLELRFMAARS